MQSTLADSRDCERKIGRPDDDVIRRIAMKLQSTAFADGSPIPKKHTADGPDVSPLLAWSDVPAGTQAFALYCDYPDAPRGTWVHWVLFNLPANTTSLPAGYGNASPTGGAVSGHNDFGKSGYGGPSPPRVKPHR